MLASADASGMACCELRPPNPPACPSPGTRLGVYEVTSAIGEGGMGQVHRATETTLGRQVAIKILPDVFAAKPRTPRGSNARQKRSRPRAAAASSVPGQTPQHVVHGAKSRAVVSWTGSDHGPEQFHGDARGFGAGELTQLFYAPRLEKWPHAYPTREPLHGRDH